MPEPPDQELLRSIFLMEAWDTLVALEQGVGTLCLEPVSIEAGEGLFVVTHRRRAPPRCTGSRRAAPRHAQYPREPARGGGGSGGGVTASTLSWPASDGARTRRRNAATASKTARWVKPKKLGNTQPAR